MKWTVYRDGWQRKRRQRLSGWAWPKLRPGEEKLSRGGKEYEPASTACTFIFESHARPKTDVGNRLERTLPIATAGAPGWVSQRLARMVGTETWPCFRRSHRGSSQWSTARRSAGRSQCKSRLENDHRPSTTSLKNKYFSLSNRKILVSREGARKGEGGRSTWRTGGMT